MINSIQILLTILLYVYSKIKKMAKQILSGKKRITVVGKLEKLTKLLNERQLNLMDMVDYNHTETKKILRMCSRKKYSKNDLICNWELTDQTGTALANGRGGSNPPFMFYVLSGRINYNGEMSLQEIYFDFYHNNQDKICVVWDTNVYVRFLKNKFDFYGSEDEMNLQDFLYKMTKTISFQEKILNFLKS